MTQDFCQCGWPRVRGSKCANCGLALRKQGDFDPRREDQGALTAGNPLKGRICPQCSTYLVRFGDRCMNCKTMADQAAEQKKRDDELRKAREANEVRALREQRQARRESGTAHHEAGHMVATIMQGGRFDLGTIDHEQFARGGVCDITGMTKKQTAIATMAGPEAQKRFWRHRDYMVDKRGWKGDLDTVNKLVSPAELPEVEFEARRLVNKFWDTIEAVANALVEKGTLHGFEVWEIIDRETDGKLSKRRSEDMRKVASEAALVADQIAKLPSVADLVKRAKERAQALHGEDLAKSEVEDDDDLRQPMPSKGYSPAAVAKLNGHAKEGLP